MFSLAISFEKYSRCENKPFTVELKTVYWLFTFVFSERSLRTAPRRTGIPSFELRSLLLIPLIKDFEVRRSAIIEIEYTPNTKTTSPIGDVIEQISKRNKNNAIQNVLSVSNRQGFIKQSEQFENRNVASEDTSNYKIVEQNDFAFNPARINVGSIARLTPFEKGIVSPMYVCFRTQENVAPEYIDYFFESKHFYCEIQKRLEGSVRQCLSFEGLCNIPLSLPSFEIQQRIGKRIFTLEQKIKMETDLLELLNKQKQYLLRQMFI